MRATLAALCAVCAAYVRASSVPEWAELAFENSTKREINSRAVTEWRKTRKTHIDLLVGNYLSHYFEMLAHSIATGAIRFKMPRRSDGLRFYERCLPNTIFLRPWGTVPLLKGLAPIKPAGQWDWFVFNNETALFWESMQPIVKRVLDHTFKACELRATVKAPVLHFRCASAPLNRHSQYRFMRYAYLHAAARRYRRRFKEPLKRVHILTCVADDVQKAEQTRLCTAYLDDLVQYLRKEMGIEVHVSNCAHSMFEDLAIMYHAPFLISTGSTMSLLPGLARHVRRKTFVSPLLFDEASLAANSRSPGRRVGCSACDWMVQRDLSLCHCEVAAYSDEATVIAALRDSAAPAARGALANAPPERRLCARCDTVECAVFRPIACEIGAPPGKGALQQQRPGVGRTQAVRARSCSAVGAAPMSESECKAAAQRANFGRKWIGASSEAGEAPGCLLWEDGNVEFNRYAPRPEQQSCNARGTCLCKADTEMQIIGARV